MRCTAERLRCLARKHNLAPWHIASAAFEVMLVPSTRNAGNPPAVVNRAVEEWVRLQNLGWANTG